jgi:hypothetical protein
VRGNLGPVGQYVEADERERHIQVPAAQKCNTLLLWCGDSSPSRIKDIRSLKTIQNTFSSFLFSVS